MLWVYSLIATQNAGNKTCAFSTRLRTAHGLFNLMSCRGDRIVQATVDEMEETEKVTVSESNPNVVNKHPHPTHISTSCDELQFGMPTM